MWSEIEEYSFQRMWANGMNVGRMIEAEEMLASQIVELQVASMAGQLGAVAAGYIPVIAQVGVFVALGAPYLEARELAKEEESKSGFSQGFVMGILGWEGRHVSSLFYRHGVIRINQMDEEMNTIRVKNYNAALISGFLFGRALPEVLRKDFVRGLRKLAGHPSAGRWTRNNQISFVISLASTLRTYLRQ